MNRPKCFYYITHKDNLKSILKKGLLSHRRANAWSFKNWIIKKQVIYDKDVIERRKKKTFKNHSLLDYANVYFQARNPMLYRVIKEFGEREIIVLEIKSSIINNSDAVITDGNAAVLGTHFFDYKNIDKGLSCLDKTLFEKGYWIDIEDGKRKIMAEVLIPNQIPRENITGIYTNSQQTSQKIKEELKGSVNDIPVISHPWMFFLPKFQKNISKKISLVKEDMFFSKMQTFTITVNTVGIMGKGLASRAKYQFPDVYVRYQDLCRQRKLKMGIPYLYKRTKNFERELMEDTSSTVTENGNRWFLLFPTKNHWREKSPLEGIKKGLEWLRDNYKNQGIESIALPALGCGLGGLDWKNVGPLMCQYLNQMDIESSVYLPLEGQIPKEQLSADFLLSAG